MTAEQASMAAVSSTEPCADQEDGLRNPLRNITWRRVLSKGQRKKLGQLVEGMDISRGLDGDRILLQFRNGEKLVVSMYSSLPPVVRDTTDECGNVKTAVRFIKLGVFARKGPQVISRHDLVLSLVGQELFLAFIVGYHHLGADGGLWALIKSDPNAKQPRLEVPYSSLLSKARDLSTAEPIKDYNNHNLGEGDVVQPGPETKDRGIASIISLDRAMGTVLLDYPNYAEESMDRYDVSEGNKLIRLDNKKGDALLNAIDRPNAETFPNLFRAFPPVNATRDELINIQELSDDMPANAALTHMRMRVQHREALQRVEEAALLMASSEGTSRGTSAHINILAKSELEIGAIHDCNVALSEGGSDFSSDSDTIANDDPSLLVNLSSVVTPRSGDSYQNLLRDESVPGYASSSAVQPAAGRQPSVQMAIPVLKRPRPSDQAVPQEQLSSGVQTPTRSPSQREPEHHPLGEIVFSHTLGRWGTADVNKMVNEPSDFDRCPNTGIHLGDVVVRRPLTNARLYVIKLQNTSEGVTAVCKEAMRNAWMHSPTNQLQKLRMEQSELQYQCADGTVIKPRDTISYQPSDHSNLPSLGKFLMGGPEMSIIALYIDRTTAHYITVLSDTLERKTEDMSNRWLVDLPYPPGSESTVSGQGDHL